MSTLPGHEVADPGDPKERGRVGDVHADDDLRGEWKEEEHGEGEERAAPDRGQSDDEAADEADRDRDDPIPRREPAEAGRRPSWVQERLGNERGRPEQQGVAEHLALHGVDAVAVAVGEVGRSPHSEEGRGRAPDQHPAREPGSHGAETAVPGAPERLEDGAVEDVRADRHGRVEVEKEDQERRHEGAAAHPGHPDEEPGDQTGEDQERVVQAGALSERRGRRTSRAA
jgi:hypothetical protein